LSSHHPAGLAKKVSFACATYSPTDPARVDHDCANRWRQLWFACVQRSR
jgi:hypothetical protein